MSPLLIFAAALSLFFAATKWGRLSFRELAFLLRTNKYSRTRQLNDSDALMNVCFASVKIAAVFALASIALAITFWNAPSPFLDQPVFLKLSLTMKSASDWLIIPLLVITALTLIYFLRWGWYLRFEGVVAEAAATTGIKEKEKKTKKKMSSRGALKSLGLFVYTFFLLTAFDFIYVFYVFSNDNVSPSTRALATTALAQVKSTLLSERWLAGAAAKLLKPTKRFNFLVWIMSAIMLINAIVVPSVLVLLLDDRCFASYDFPLFGRLLKQDPHEAIVPYTFCGYIDNTQKPICPYPAFPNDGYITNYYSTVFDYPWTLSNQCGSAVIETYSPVVLLSLIFSDVLQPATWWLCRENKSKQSQWIILSMALFVSIGLPQVAESYASAIDGAGWWALGVGVQVTFASGATVTGGLLKLLRKKKEDQELDENAATENVDKAQQSWWWLPPVEYLLDVFGYNFDEEMLFGNKRCAGSWPLKDAIAEAVQRFGSRILDNFGFARGDHLDDDQLREAFNSAEYDEEEVDEGEGAESNHELHDEDSEKPAKSPQQGRDLANTYADLIKNFGVALTYGLANPMIALFAATGIVVRAFALSFLVKMWNDRVKSGELEARKTDAQGIPFRCIISVAAATVMFFSSAAIVSGVAAAGDDDGSSPTYVFVTLGVCALLLLLQMSALDARKVYKKCIEQLRAARSKVPEDSDSGDGDGLDEPLLDKA
jgi:hypothetical protein